MGKLFFFFYFQEFDINVKGAPSKRQRAPYILLIVLVSYRLRIYELMLNSFF